MTTGTDIATDAIAQIGESVERAASLLAGGERLAGPAAAQDDASELVADPAGVGLSMTFADGSVVAVQLVADLAAELCGGTGPDQITAGLQVVVDEVAGGRNVGLVDVSVLTSGADLVAALAGRTPILGAGIFDGDAVVATVGGAPGDPSFVESAGDVDPAAAAMPDAAAAPLDDVPAAAPAAAAAAPAAPAPALNLDGAAIPARHATGPTVPDDVLARGLALLADVNLDVTVELGRSHLRVSELLALEPGAVIGLERPAGSPVDLLVNGSLFARGEVIVHEGSYAVRIIELVGSGITP